MNKRKGVYFGAFLGLILAMPSGAALRYTIVTDIQREGGKAKTDRLVERVTVDGDKGRIDFLAPDGGSQANAGYLLTLDGGRTIAWSDGDEAVCANWSIDEFFATVGALLEKGTRFINAELPDATLEKTLEETGPELHGYPTKHLRLVTKFGAKGRVLILKFEYAAEQTDDVWMTSELELPALEKRWVEGLSRTGFEYLDALSTSWDQEVNGAVLKHRNVVRLTNLQSGEVSIKTETMEVTELERLEPSDIPEAIFAMPKCEQVDDAEMKKRAKKFIKNSLK